MRKDDSENVYTYKIKEIYFNRGDAYSNIGNHKKSIKDYTTIIDQTKEDAAGFVADLTLESHFKRGSSFLILGNNTAAIKDFTAIIENKYPYTSKEEIIAQSYSMRCLAKTNIKDSRGIIDCNKAIELKTDDSDLFNNRGNARFNLNDYRGAIQDYNKVIELSPNNAYAYHNRGLAKLNLEQKDSGCLDLSKAGELGSFEAYDIIKDACD